MTTGRPYIAIPGPSVMPDRVLAAMHRAAPDIYDPALPALVNGIVDDLRALARTSGKMAAYIANGHGTWEAAVANVLRPGDRVLVLATGRFALGWAAVAERMGVTCQILDFGNRATIDLARVSEVLAADQAHAIRAVMCVQVDTATSIRNDIAALRQAIDAAGHPALFMVDCIASFACERFEMDAWGVDVMITASQKGLMTPPGMGFVFFNQRADAMRGENPRVSQYWDWRPRIEPEEFYLFFDGTAPTHLLYGLREALDMIAEEGIEAVWQRHALNARCYWAALEAWGQGGPIEPNVTDPALRSHAVTAVRAGSPNGTALRDWLRENAGVTLGVGLGMADRGDPAWHGFFRIGHMGHVNGHMVMGVIGAMDAALKALEIPHGDGAPAAASAVLAGRA